MGDRDDHNGLSFDTVDQRVTKPIEKASSNFRFDFFACKKEMFLPVELLDPER